MDERSKETDGVVLYSGVVTVTEGAVPVTLGFDEGRIRLSAEGKEIGDWALEECVITYVGEDVYNITAEDESLRFVPSDPDGFATAINGDAGIAPEEKPLLIAPDPTPRSEAEAPEPRPVTMVLFYALAALTAGLGIWALLSLIF